MAPIEDASLKPTDPIKGAIGVFWDRVKSAWIWVRDLTVSSIKNFNPLETARNMAVGAVDFAVWTKNFAVWSVKTLMKDFNPFDTDALDSATIDQSISFNEEQKKLWKQFNEIWWWQLAKDIWWAVFQWLDNYLFWTDIEKNLKAWTSIRDFNNKTTELQKSINDLQEKVESVYDEPKYKELSDFYSNVYNQYIQRYGDTWAVDFETFYAQRFYELTPQQQKRLENQINWIQNDIKTIQSELEKKQQEMQWFINANIVPSDWKTWFDIYNETQQEAQDVLKKNKYFSLIGDIYFKADEKVSNDIGWLWLKNISDFEWIDNLKSALVDNLAVSKQFELTVLWNELLPDREELAKKIATANRAKYRFDLAFVKNYTEARWQEKYKWLSEVELRKAVEKYTWINLDNSEKELIMSREIMINQISQINAAMQMWERLSNLNPMWLLDLLSYSWVTIKRMIDAWFNYDQDVPHYVQQSNRNLIYSNEWNWDKFKSVITYNPDVILSSALMLAISKKPVDWFEKAVTKMWQWAITRLPANIWFGKWVVTFLWTKARALTSSQIYWAWMDPILDTHLEEAPSKTLEQFNQITNLFFDVWTIWLEWISNRWTKSMNSLMYKFSVQEDKKAVVKDAVKFLNENHWIKISEVDMYNAMEHASQIYKTLFNPEEAKALFTEDKALYNFVMDNLKKMDEFNLKELLTEKWIWLQRIAWDTIDTLYNNFKSKDVFDAYEKIVEASKITTAKTPDEIQLKIEWQLAKEIIDNVEEKFRSYFTKWQTVDWFQFDSNNYKDSKFLEIKKQADELVDTIMTNIKSWWDRKTIESDISRFDKLLYNAQREFKSNKEFVEYVEMRMPFSDPIQIDLSKFNEITWVTLQEAFKNWSVTIKAKKWYKDWTYTFIDDNPLENLNMDLREYLKTKEWVINDFISEFAEKYNITSEALNIRVLKHNILIPLLFGSSKSEWWRSGTINLDFLYNLSPDIQVIAVNEIWQQLSELINGFFWMAKWYQDIKTLDINSYYPKFENKTGSKLKDYEMASIKDITSVTNEEEWFFNIATWVFKTNDWKYINSMYFLPWKELLKDDWITKAFTLYDKKDNYIDGTMAQLTSSMTEIKKILFSNVKKWDTMDFLVWVEKASAWYYGGVSYFKEWKLDTDRVIWLVDTIINNYNKNNRNKLDASNIKTIKEFIKESFAWLDDSYDMFIGSMIYNLTTAYIKDSKLITEVVKNIDNIDYKKLFAKLLVNDSQKQLLINRFSKWQPEVKLPESVTNILKWQREQFLQELKVKKIVHEDNLERLNKFLEDNKWIIDDTLLQMYNTKKGEIERNIEYINRQSTTFKWLDLYTTKQFISQFLEKKLENFTDLINVNEKVREEIQSKYTKQKDKLRNSIEDLQKVWPDKFKEYSSIIDEYIKAVENNNLEEAVIIANKIDDTNVKKSVINYANALKDKIVLDEFIAKENITDQLFETHNVWKWIFNYEEAIEKNPLLTSITSSITWNKTWDSVWVYERIRWVLYDEQPTVETTEVKQKPVIIKTKWWFENKGKWTPQWDWKDKAMRLISDSFIWEILSKSWTDDYIESSTKTSYKEISGRFSKKENWKEFIDIKDWKIWDWYFIKTSPNIVMLARNWKFSWKDLKLSTKELILEAKNKWASFVVWDMPNVDSQFIDYLQEIWADFTIYHTWNKPRINIKTSEVPVSTQPKVKLSKEQEDKIKELEGKIKILETETLPVDNSDKIKLIEKEIEDLKNQKNEIQKFFLFSKNWKDYYTNEWQTEWIIKIRNYLDSKTEAPFILIWPWWTWKTAVIWKAIEWTDKEVIFLWPTHKSVKVLKASNSKSGLIFNTYKTIDSFVWNILKFSDWKNTISKKNTENEEIIINSIIIIDEASMLWNKKEKWEQFWKLDNLLLKLKWWNNKIIFMWDPLQAPPVWEKISPVFASWYNWHELTETMRQKWESQIVKITNKYRDNLLSSNRIFNPVGNDLRETIQSKNWNVSYTNHDIWISYLSRKIKENINNNEEIEYRYLSYYNPYKMKNNDPNIKIRKNIFWEKSKEIITEWELLITYSPINKLVEWDEWEKIVNIYPTSDDITVKEYLWKETTQIWENKISFDEFMDTVSLRFLDDGKNRIIEKLKEIHKKNTWKEFEYYDQLRESIDKYYPNFYNDLYDLHNGNKKSAMIDMHKIIDSNWEEIKVVFVKDVEDLKYEIQWYRKWDQLTNEEQTMIENIANLPQVHYWYWLTTHKSQWSTYKWVVVDEKDLLNLSKSKYWWTKKFEKKNWRSPTKDEIKEWEEEQLVERNKLLYVATSRPTQDLVIIWDKKVNNSIESHNFLKDEKIWNVNIESVDITIDWNSKELIREKRELIKDLQNQKVKKDNSKEISKLREQIKEIEDWLVETPTISKDIESIKNNLLEQSNKIKLVWEWDNSYYEVNWERYDRVSKQEWTSQLTSKKIASLPYWFKSVDFWKKHEKILEDFFNWNIPENTLTTDEQFESYIKKLWDLKEYINKNWETFIWTWIKVAWEVDGKKIAWTVSMITANKDWSLNLYAFSSRKKNPNKETESEIDFKRFQTTVKQNKYYTQLLNQMWYNVDNIHTYIVRVAYEEKSTISRLLRLEKYVNYNLKNLINKKEWFKNLSYLFDKYISDWVMTNIDKDILLEIFKDTDDKLLNKIKYNKKDWRSVAWYYSWEWISVSSNKQPIVTFLHEYWHLADDILLSDKEKKIVSDFLKKNKKEINNIYKEYWHSQTHINYYLNDYREFLAQEFTHYVLTNTFRVKWLSGVIKKLYSYLKKNLIKLLDGLTNTKINKIEWYSDLENIFEKLIKWDITQATNNFDNQFNNLDIKYNWDKKEIIINWKWWYWLEDNWIGNIETWEWIIFLENYKIEDLFNKDWNLKNESKDDIRRWILQNEWSLEYLWLKTREEFFNKHWVTSIVNNKKIDNELIVNEDLGIYTLLNTSDYKIIEAISWWENIPIGDVVKKWKDIINDYNNNFIKEEIKIVKKIADEIWVPISIWKEPTDTISNLQDDYIHKFWTKKDWNDIVDRLNKVAIEISLRYEWIKNLSPDVKSTFAWMNINAFSDNINKLEKKLNKAWQDITKKLNQITDDNPAESDILKQIKDLTEVVWSNPKTWDLIYKAWSFTKMRDQVYEILEKAIGDVKIKAIKTDWTPVDNITPELLIWLKKNIWEVIKKIRSINRQTNYWDDKVKSRLINIKWKRVDEPWSEYSQIYNVANMDSTVEWVLKIHNMINNWMDIYIMNMNNKQLLQNAWVVSPKWTKTTTLWKIFDWKNAEKLRDINKKLWGRTLEDITDPTEIDKLFKLYNSISQEDKAIYAIREFAKVFNRDKEWFDTFTGITKKWKEFNVSIKNPKELFENIWVLDLYNQWYYFAWNFWDKASVHQFYRANKDLIQALSGRGIISNQFDIQRLSKALYEVDYAYAEWYLKQKWTRNNFQEVVDYLSKVDKYEYEWEEVIVKWIEDIEKIIEQIREEELIKRLSIKKREAAQMSNYSLIQWEDAKKPLNTFVLQAIHQEDNIKTLFNEITWYKLEYENWKLNDDLLLSIVNVNAFEWLTLKEKNELILKYNKLWIEWASPVEIVDVLSKNYDQLIENFEAMPVPENWWGKVWKHKSMYDYAKAQLWTKPPTENIEKWIQFIEWVYLKDNDDWTSYATEDVIIKLLQHEKNISYKKAKEIVTWKQISWIKAHSSEILDVNVGTEEEKKIRKISFLWKHYINTAKVEWYTWAHFVWANSAKLDSAVQYYKKEDYKTITIWWKDYKIVGEVPWTTYWIFKNATSTLTREHDDTTISNSILAILSDKAASNVEDLIKWLIRDKYRATLQSLTNPKAEIEVWSQIDKAISMFIEKTDWVWLWSPSIIQAKINELLKYVSKVIDKPSDKWQSVFIKYSDHTLSPNEMKMWPNSELVKQMREYSAETLYSKSYTALDAKEKDMVDANLFTTWYRYPVPTKYNLWTYRVIVDDSLANNEVITNPLTTYIKIEWDNDWDHLFFIPTLSKWWSEISKDLLNYKWDKFFDYLSEWNWNNDFIIADQIKKGKSTWNPTLLDMRLTAIDWKKRVWVVSATGRTIKLLIQMFGNEKKYNDVKVWISELDLKWNKVEKIITFAELAKRYEWLGKTDMKAQLESYASILQLTIDFGSSDATKFDNLWYFELLWAIKYGDEMMDTIKQTKAKYDAWKIDELTTEEKKIFIDIVNENEIVMSWFWKKYGNDSFLNAGKIWKISGDIDEKEKTLAYVLWSKWNILRDFVDNYWADIGDLNKNDSIQFFIDNVIPSTWAFKDWKIKLKQAAKDWYYATYKEQIPKMYETLSKDHKFFDTIEWQLTSYKTWNGLVVFGHDEQLKAFYNKFEKISEKPVKYKYVWDNWSEVIINSREDVFKIFKQAFPKEKDSLYSKLMEEINKLKASNKITPEYLDLIDKVKRTKTFVEEDKKAMYELKEEIQNKIQELQVKDTDKDKNWAIAVMLTSLLLWDSNTFALLTNPKQVEYLLHTTEKLQTTYDAIRTRRPDVISEKDFNDKVDWIKKEIKSLETQEWNEKAIADLETKLKELNEEYSKLEDPFIKDEVIKQATPEKDVDILLPMIQERFIDIDTQSAQQMMYNFSHTVVEWDTLLKTKVSQFFHKYVPDFVAVYNNIRDFMNRDLIISKAVEDDIRHMQVPYFIWARTWLMSVLKKSWISNLWDFTREIQEAILTFEKWKVILKENDLIIDKLRTSELVMWTVWEKLLQPKDKWWLLEDFIRELDDYKLKVWEPVAYKINRLKEVYNYDVWSSYKDNQRKSLLSDVLTSHKSDWELALKVYWIKTKDEFIKLLADRWLTNDWFFNKGHIKMMTSVLFKWDQDWLDKLLWFVKAFHYELTYWLTSTIFTQNWIIAWIAQILPNHMEMQSYIRRYWSDLSQAMMVMNKYWLLDSENVRLMWTWLWKNQNNKSIVDELFTRTLSLAWMNYPKTNTISSMIHMITTNPLWAWDLPAENLRKLWAILQTMQEHWFKNIEDIDKFVRLNWESFLWRFRSSVNKNFAESGWGVVSASQIYRDTVFTHLHEYINIPWLHMAAKFFSQTIWYLMWWAYHKTATILEKEWAAISAICKFARGNTSWAKKDLNDWFQFNHGIALYTAYSLWIHMKFQKFEKDNNERISFGEFNRSFNNHLVAYEILVDRRMSNWETAWEFWTMWDQFKYTAVSEVRNVLRLFKQPKIVMDLYNHYEMSKLHWQQDIFTSIKFVMDNHYSWYGKFNWLTKQSDIYNTLQINGVHWILWVWWLTDEEELFKKLMSGKMFNSFQDKWVFKTLLNTIVYADSDDASYSILILMAKNIKELALKDPEIRKLISWWKLGTWEDDFNLNQLLWNTWDIIDNEMAKQINDLYNYLLRSWLSSFDVEWKIDESRMSKYQLMMKDNLDKALNKEWLTIDALMAPWVDLEYKLQKLSDISFKYDIPHPVAVSLVLDTVMRNRVNEKLRREKRSYTQLDYIEAKRDIMLENQDILNLNSDFVFEVIANRTRSEYWDVIKEYEKKFKNARFGINDWLDILNRSYLIGQVIDNDTSVAKLHSKYTLAFKWISSNQAWVDLVNNFLQWVEALPYLDKKTKLANQAAAIMGMNKSLYGLLKDNDEFMKLTADSRKLLANWMYKVWKESIQFDSNSYLNELNSIAYKPRSWYGRMTPISYKSKPFGWTRPNFSKQFEPIRQMIPNVIQDLARDPDRIIRNRNPYIDAVWYNWFKNPVLKRFIELQIQALYRWYRSEWIIKQNKKVDSIRKKDIKLKKEPKRKDKFITKK